MRAAMVKIALRGENDRPTYRTVADYGRRGGLCITKGRELYAGEYVITHVRTGMRVPLPEAQTLKEARAILNAVAGLRDWKAEDPAQGMRQSDKCAITGAAWRALERLRGEA